MLTKPTPNRVRELRFRAGLSAEDLREAIAAQTGERVSSSSLLKIEKGAMPLSADWRQRIARALGVETWELDRENASGVPVLDWREFLAGRREVAGDPEREHLPWNGPAARLVALRARDNHSNADAGILPGDYLVVRLTDGTDGLAVVVNDDGTTAIRHPAAGDIVAAEVIEVRRPLKAAA